jgi:hypothetical protein
MYWSETSKIIIGSNSLPHLGADASIVLHNFWHMALLAYSDKCIDQSF